MGIQDRDYFKKHYKEIERIKQRKRRKRKYIVSLFIISLIILALTVYFINK